MCAACLHSRYIDKNVNETVTCPDIIPTWASSLGKFLFSVSPDSYVVINYPPGPLGGQARRGNQNVENSDHRQHPEAFTNPDAQAMPIGWVGGSGARPAGGPNFQQESRCPFRAGGSEKPDILS